jgi:hypothetical protein
MALMLMPGKGAGEAEEKPQKAPEAAKRLNRRR